MHERGHPGNRLGDLEIVSFEDEVIRVRAERAATGTIVLKSDRPLLVEAAEGADARLRPGWDGTLGYSLYALELSFAVAGEAVVRLRSVPPPDTAVAATEDDLTAFREELCTRASRFTDEPTAFPLWRQSYRAKLAAVLMGGGFPKRVPLEPKVTEEKDYPAFTLRRVECRTQADRANVLLLSLPKGVEHAPLLLALHGHEAGWGRADEAAYSSGHSDDFCATFAERGWAVLQPATMDHTLQHEGWTLQGEWTWDAMVALDYAGTAREIDMARVAVCGLSTGGHLAMNILALDDRVRTGVVGCVLSTWNHYRKRCRVPPHCDCGIAYQLQPHLAQCDWAALAAPKPVQFQHGRRDAALGPGADPKLLDLRWNAGVLPQAEYDAAFSEVRRAYRLTGKPDRVETAYHAGPHKVDNRAAYLWLCKWLDVEPRN